jgi:hypothetical protein
VCEREREREREREERERERERESTTYGNDSHNRKNEWGMRGD